MTHRVKKGVVTEEITVVDYTKVRKFTQNKNAALAEEFGPSNDCHIYHGVQKASIYISLFRVFLWWHEAEINYFFNGLHDFVMMDYRRYQLGQWLQNLHYVQYLVVCNMYALQNRRSTMHTRTLLTSFRLCSLQKKMLIKGSKDCQIGSSESPDVIKQVESTETGFESGLTYS